MPSRPGPRVAESRSLVRVTCAPTRTPWVSSKICRSARRFWTRSTSPLSCAFPTCTKATEFFMIGASLSMRTMFPVTPVTRVSGVEFCIFTHRLRDQRFENCPASLGLQLLPMADDVPSSDVQHHGFEAEAVVVLHAFPQISPRFPQHPTVEGEHILVLEQLIERKKPGEDVAKPEVGLVEVATDVSEPIAEPNHGRTQSVVPTPQGRDDHTHVDANAKDLVHQRVG